MSRHQPQPVMPFTGSPFDLEQALRAWTTSVVVKPLRCDCRLTLRIFLRATARGRRASTASWWC